MQNLRWSQHHEPVQPKRFFRTEGLGKYDLLIPRSDITQELVYISRYTSNSIEQVMGWPTSFRARIYEQLVELKNVEIEALDVMNMGMET